MSEPAEVLWVSGRDELRTADSSEHAYRRLADADVDLERVLVSRLGDRIEVSRPHCIVCPSDITESDPIAVVDAIRSRDRDVAVVLLAVDGTDRLAHRAVAAGVTEYVPVDPDPEHEYDLGGAVQRAIADCNQSRERGRASAKLEALFEYTPDPVVEYEFGGDELLIRSANRAFAETFGYDREAIVGEPMNDLIVPDEKRAEARRLDERVREGNRVATELQRQTASGRREFLFRNIAVETGSNGPDGYAVYVDITDQKERERQLQKQNERLNEFASVVSHDLRNPMGAVKQRIEMACQTGDMDHLDDALDALDRMDELLRELLRMARQGDEVGRTEPVALSNVAESAWTHVATGDATLTVDDDRTIDADRGRLMQLLENLFINAVEHSSAGPSTGDGDETDIEFDASRGSGVDSDDPDSSIEVSVGVQPDDCLYVEDDGQGIPPDDRQKVFKTGFSTGNEGTGFGLAIVRQVAHAHGWDVGVTDGIDGGARFEFRGVKFHDS